MDIPRLIEKKIEAELGKQKVIMLYGARRTGKTTIIENIAARHGNDVILLQGEDMQVAALLQQRTVANYNQLTKGISIIATGSSSFDLVHHTGEPLVGHLRRVPRIMAHLQSARTRELFETIGK